MRWLEELGIRQERECMQMPITQGWSWQVLSEKRVLLCMPVSRERSQSRKVQRALGTQGLQR